MISDFLHDIHRARAMITTAARRISRRAKRILILVSVTLAGILIPMAPAVAEDVNNPPSVVSWMKIVDSHGISVWAYSLSLDNGGVMHPAKLICSFFITLIWELYRVVMSTALWLIDWVLSFSWLKTLTSPMQSLANSLSSVLGSFGATAACLTIAGAFGAIWLLRGRFGTGIYEILASCVVATLATGMLANPVASVGGSGGWLMGARDLGLGVASRMSIDGSTGVHDNNADATRTRLNGELATTFIRIPSQLINYGELVETGKCAPVYKALAQKKDGHYGLQSSDAYKVMELCSKSAKDRASNPSVDMIISAGVVGVGGAFMLIFALLLAGVVLFASLFALYAAIKTIFNLVWGLLPGNSRSALAMGLAEILTSLAIVVFSIVFLMSYLMLINSLLAPKGSSTGDVIRPFLFVDIMLVIGMVIFWKGRTALAQSASRLSQGLLKRPGGGAPSSPARHAAAGSGLRSMARVGSQAALMSKAGMLGQGSPAAALGAAAVGATTFPIAATYLAARGVGAAGRAAASRFRNASGGATDAGQPASSTAGSGGAGVPASFSGALGSAERRALTAGSSPGAIAPPAGKPSGAKAALVSGSHIGQSAGQNPRRQQLTSRLTSATAAAAKPSTSTPSAAPGGTSPSSRPTVAGPRRPQQATADAGGRTGYERIRVNGQTLYVPKV